MVEKIKKIRSIKPLTIELEEKQGLGLYHGNIEDIKDMTQAFGLMKDKINELVAQNNILNRKIHRLERRNGAILKYQLDNVYQTLDTFGDSVPVVTKGNGGYDFHYEDNSTVSEGDIQKSEDGSFRTVVKIIK